MDSFVDLMWPKIQQLIPETVSLPAVEIYNQVIDTYLCATNTTVQAKIGNILNKKLLLKSKEKFTFEVEADLLLDAKPVEIGIAKKLDYDKASPTVPVSYMFNEPSKVRFVLEIVNFLGKRNILTPMCIVKVKNILVVELSEPEPLSKTTDEELMAIEEEFEENFISNDDTKVLGTIGLVRAANERLNANTSFWVCSSRYFNKVEEDYKKEWEYSDNYTKYCLKKGMNN